VTDGSIEFMGRKINNSIIYNLYKRVGSSECCHYCARKEEESVLLIVTTTIKVRKR